jgi:acyl dehydratase
MNILSLGYKEVRLPKRTVKNEDIVKFADLTGDKNRIHLDDMFAANSPFGKRISHGLFSIAMIFGLMDETHLFDDLIVILKEIERVEFVKPVYDSDIISGRVRIIEKTESFRHDGFYVTAEIVGLKENDGDQEFVKMRAKFKLITLINERHERDK